MDAHRHEMKSTANGKRHEKNGHAASNGGLGPFALRGAAARALEARPYIKLDQLTCEGGKLTYHFSSSLPLFKKNRFFIRYEGASPSAKGSVNAIPFAAVMMPIAWAAGAELSLPMLDEEYARSLEEVSLYHRKWFGRRWSFNGRLLTHRIRNLGTGSDSAMLFSSGLDSLTTYVRHREKKPHLFTVFGADIPLANESFIRSCRERFSSFARSEGVPLTFVYTDIREIFDDKQLRKYSKNWYGEVAHGLILTSLIAPVSPESIRTLYLASCYHAPGCTYACGSDYELVRPIRWCGSRVESDNQGMTRVEKVALCAKLDASILSALRVCWMQFQAYNCTRCEKCLRTICELLLNNVDPARCNFSLNEGTLPGLRRRIEAGFYDFFRSESQLDFWRAIQDGIDLDRIQDLYGSREFFTWLRGFRPLRKRHSPFVVKVARSYLEVRDALSKWKAEFLQKTSTPA